MKKRLYRVVWSDALHAFGEPAPIKESERELYRFPDAVIYAKNLNEARLMVKLINRTYKNKPREEIPSIFEFEEV
jgi:hypothetical protein